MAAFVGGGLIVAEYVLLALRFVTNLRATTYIVKNTIHLYTNRLCIGVGVVVYISQLLWRRWAANIW